MLKHYVWDAKRKMGKGDNYGMPIDRMWETVP